MLEKIKSDYIKTTILEYIESKKILQIFKYNQFYQKKFNIKKSDNLCEYYKNDSKDFYDSIYIVNSRDFKS